MRALDTEIEALRPALSPDATPAHVLVQLNAHFFGPGGFAATSDLQGPEGVSVASVLETRRGTCVGLAIVYLALAERLGLDARAVATPAHLFIRVRADGKLRNVELLEGGSALDDDIYTRRFKIDPASIASGVFLRDLTGDEVLAHLLSNQAVHLSKEGRLEEALERYERALSLAPRLVAAWYNRGLDLMNADRLEEALASFNRAIELHTADAQAHNNRGLVRLKLGDTEGAREDFRRALQIEPSLPEADQNLRRLESDTGGRP